MIGKYDLIYVAAAVAVVVLILLLINALVPQ
jgi:hypothetical protein